MHTSESTFPDGEYDNEHSCIVLFEPVCEIGFLKDYMLLGANTSEIIS
jgi:hypothetical protein